MLYLTVQPVLSLTEPSALSAFPALLHIDLQVNVDNIDADLFGSSTQNPFSYTPQDPSIGIVRGEAINLVQDAYLDCMVCAAPFICCCCSKLSGRTVNATNFLPLVWHAARGSKKKLHYPLASG